MTDEDDRPVESRHEIQHQYPANVRFCALCGGAMELRTVLPDRKRLKVCSRCGFIDFQSPKLVAGCLVIDAGRVLLLRVAATAPDGCKDKNSRYKKRAPNYPIRCCHVRTLNQLSLAACQAHPASPPRWIHGTAAKQSQPLVTIGAGALPTGYLPIGALPIGAFPTGACE